MTATPGAPRTSPVGSPGREVRLRDVTLREVVASDGMALTVDDRLAVLRALAALPVAVAEADAPGSLPGDSEFFRRAREELDAGPTVLSVVGRVTPWGPPAASDGGLATVLAAGTPRVSLKVDGRVAPAATRGCGPAETMAAVCDAVGFLLSEGRRVVLDVEHAVDAFGADPVCLVDLVATGLDAGADAVVLDDTEGLALPDRVVGVMEAVAFGVGPELGVACGDASGCAVANSLLAVGVGARWIQTSARPGTADLATVVRDLTRDGVATLRPVPDADRLDAAVAALHRALSPDAATAGPTTATRPAAPARRGAVGPPARPLAQA